MVNFEALESLRLLGSEILRAQAKSLQYFEYEHGYAHLAGQKKRSVSSTATCTLSLVANRDWPATQAETKELLHYLIQRTESAGLVPDNPFTTAWILEAVTALSSFADPLDPVDLEEISRKESVLTDFIKNSSSGGISMPLEMPAAPASREQSLSAGNIGGSPEADNNTPTNVSNARTDPQEQLPGERSSARVAPKPSGKVVKGDMGASAYPPSAYLTQLVVRALRKRRALSDELAKRVKEWAWSELARQYALVQAGSKSQDPFSVAYLVVLVTTLTPKSSITPDEASIRKAALATFFKCQLPDGSWPLSRPLFHYPKFGNAYCYEYEMLTQLLGERELQDLLLDSLPSLEQALRSATLTNVYRLENGVLAWTSGHHPQIGRPESWATASVYNFVQVLDVLLAEAVRRELLRYLELPQPTATFEQTDGAEFAKDVLDGPLTIDGRVVSLKEQLRQYFVNPISKEASRVASGGKFDKSTPRSAILYGPPGTSKTEMSKKLAEFLGWPFLALDPSFLLRHGMDGIQAEANTIFRTLEQTDAVVVLFDEFDELVRERGAKAEQPFSRLLTTSMLPKLARLRKRGTLVFLIATNNISEFDLAISRRGRFDKVFQVMPPLFEEKLKFKGWGPKKNIDINAIFTTLQINVDDDVKRRLGELTFDETDALAVRLAKATTAQEAIEALARQWSESTMQMKVPKTQSTHEEEITWAERCRAEAALSH